MKTVTLACVFIVFALSYIRWNAIKNHEMAAMPENKEHYRQEMVFWDRTFWLVLIGSVALNTAALLVND